MSNLKQHKLDQLAAEFNRLAGELEDIDRLYETRPTIWHGMGVALVDMKTRVGHGNWATFVESHLTKSLSQCQRYTKLVKEYPELKNLVNKAFTSLDNALGYAETQKLKKAQVKEADKVRAEEQVARDKRKEVADKEKAEFIAEYGEVAWVAEKERRYQEGEHVDHARARREWVNDWRVNGNHVRPPDTNAATMQAYADLELYPVSEFLLKIAHKELMKIHHPDQFREGTPEHDDATERAKSINRARDVLKPTTKRD